ncbi:MAG: SusC/RagA family TonB-linked outer membrane protein [Sediminibacterium sp.]
MKLTAILLFLFALQSMAETFAQVTLKEKNATLEKVLQTIKKQSGYDLVYQKEMVRSKGKPVAVNLSNVTLSTALELIFKDQDLDYELVGKIITVREKNEKIATLLNSRINSGDVSTPLLPIDVNGTVKDESGKPVVGASVQVKGTNKGTTTNNDGKFILTDVDDKATLVISAVNIETREVGVNGRKEISLVVKMKVGKLEDVEITTVSTGYQQLPKERATGSFTQIGSKLYNEQVGTNVLERLKYISNGVSVFPQSIGTSAKDQLIIRGISTLTMSIQKPLIIVDNFEYQGDLSNINPNDIESVTFLKDAAASSIWGAKAANGVIVLTTKKGRYNQKTTVEFNSNFSITEKPDLFYQQSISSADLIDVETFLFGKQFRFADTLSNQRLPFSPVYEILFKRRNGLISAADSTLQINALKNHDIRNDFLKYLYRKAVSQQYAASVRGGSGNINWLFSAGFDKNISELDAAYNRTNLRFDNTYKVSSKIEISSSVFYTNSKTVSGKPAYGSIGTAPVYTKLADENGNALPLYTYYRQGYIDTIGGGKLLDWRYYPLDNYRHERSNGNIENINGAFAISYKPLAGLSVDVKYRYEKQHSDLKTLYDLQSYFTRNMVNRFSQLNRSTGDVTYKVPRGDIFDETNAITTAQNLRTQVGYNNRWKQQEVSIIAGMESSEAIREFTVRRTYGYNADILTYSNVDHTTFYPLFIAGADFIGNPARFGKTNNRFVSFFGNAAYTYNNKYTVSGSMRRDASNIFGVATNDKWKPLWSTGLSWNIDRESFYKIKWLPNLKLRVTYGHQGNLDPSKVSATTISYNGTTFYNAPYSSISNFVNPELRWEQVAMLNTGIDFALPNKRISGTIEWYYKHVTDLYGPSIIDATTGLNTTTLTKNIGSLKGNGIDVQINTVNIERPVRWTTDFIFNTYNDKITKYYDPAALKPSGLVGNGGGIEGYPSFYLSVYRWAGLDPSNGDPMGYLNGQVSKDWAAITGPSSTMEDIKFVGPRLPTIFGSIGNSISWKNISLSARISYRLHYYFLRPSIEYGNLINQLRGHADYANRWQKPGDERFTNVPSFTYPTNSARNNFYQYSEALVTKGDHIRFQYINVSYSLDRNSIKRLPLASIQFYFVINNPGMIWKANKYGIDPDFVSIPPAKTYSFGLRANF